MMKRAIDEQGNITVKVPMLWALPKVEVQKTIGNTEYHVSCSYDGKHTLPAKVLHSTLLTEGK